MSWSKQKKDLLGILEDINHINLQSGSEKDTEKYLIKWMKIRKLCTNLIGRSDLSSEDKQVPHSLLARFKQNVFPKLLTFSKSVKKVPIKELLPKFRSELQDYYDLADENIKTVPMLSFSIYEDAQFFVNLYQFVFEKSLISIVRNELYYRMSLLKQFFEVESGNKNLESSLNQPSASGITAENAAEILISEVKMPDEEIVAEKLSKQPSQTIVEPPEIAINENSNITSEIPQEIPLEGNTLSEAPVENLTSAISQKDFQFTKKQAYAYEKWFPEQNWDQFANFRYCIYCGRNILSSTRICSGCQQHYSF